MIDSETNKRSRSFKVMLHLITCPLLPFTLNLTHSVKFFLREEKVLLSYCLKVHTIATCTLITRYICHMYYNVVHFMLVTLCKWYMNMYACVCASISIRKDPQLVYCKNTRMYMCLGEIVYEYVRVCFNFVL